MSDKRKQSRKKLKKMLEKRKATLTKKNTGPFDKTNKLQKLSLLTIIVNKGQAIGVSKILKDENCSFYSCLYGNGTATRYLDELIGGKNDPSKEVITALVTDQMYKEIKPKLEARFKVSNATKGVAFKINFSKMVSVFSYRYLANVRK